MVEQVPKLRPVRLWPYFPQAAVTVTALQLPRDRCGPRSLNVSTEGCTKVPTFLSRRRLVSCDWKYSVLSCSNQGLVRYSRGLHACIRQGGAALAASILLVYPPEKQAACTKHRVK